MQDWYEFAKKNGLEIIQTGRCQLCNADTSNGIAECIEIASQITHKINHLDGVENMTIFLCVDAHALQHSEIHGRWNNHYHLTRLNLILNRKIKWSYTLSPILSEIVDSYKKNKYEEYIINPKIGNRGVVTVIDISKTKTDEEYINLVWQWASEVYKSFENIQKTVDEISELFILKAFS